MHFSQEARWAREPKSSNALHETDARSLLRRRAIVHHSMLRQLRLDSSIAISANVTLSRLFTRYLCLGAVPQKNHPEWAHAAANPCEKKRNIFV